MHAFFKWVCINRCSNMRNSLSSKVLHGSALLTSLLKTYPVANACSFFLNLDKIKNWGIYTQTVEDDVCKSVLRHLEIVYYQIVYYRGTSSSYYFTLKDFLVLF